LALVDWAELSGDCRPEEFPVMPMVFLRSMVTCRPGWIVGLWVAVACATGFLAPNLTRLAAEGQANLLGGDAESLGAAEVLRRAWPDQAYESLVVAAVHRASGLTAADLGY
jgi:putative drug exporter of the RND superfamily